MSRPSIDPAIVPQQAWKNINSQIIRLSNGLLKGKLVFKRVYTSQEGSELFERNNPVINDSGQTVYVKYRIVYDLLVSRSIKITWGIDVDENGIILYKNELPLLYEKKFPSILNCSAAQKKALAAKKEIISFASLSLYYNPLTLKFEWIFFESIDSQHEHSYAITIDAVTGSTVEIFELKPPAEILMDEELK
jgi:hypothetical protein